ncbi:DinB family protein [Dinghuibacter silviterrae]|uniref:DinB family protein n=1 Tax=Dinghuibacter silviterrae TaxID=1539049 RepID=A0A4V3GM74_9BACT|nr:DinB family protein [Dinghuibacter silviterrae]TDX02383.1 DinB family protein [Dinghuibacter silviterrae]
MNNLINDIRDTAAALQEALSAFDPESFNVVPYAGSWTAGQVTDHLVKAGGVTRILHGRTVPTQRRPDEKVEMLRHIFLDFNAKMKAPDFIVPGDGPFVFSEQIATLTDIWGGIAESSRTLDPTLTCADMELPVFGLLTRLEWISFYMVHTQRHIHQLHRIQTALRRRAVHS